jgi:hypothetical protein
MTTRGTLPDPGIVYLTLQMEPVIQSRRRSVSEPPGGGNLDMRRADAVSTTGALDILPVWGMCYAEVVLLWSLEIPRVDQ